MWNRVLQSVFGEHEEYQPIEGVGEKRFGLNTQALMYTLTILVVIVAICVGMILFMGTGVI